MEVLRTEALINAVQNEPCIWDSTMNETEENKDLAWKRICDSCGLPKTVSFNKCTISLGLQRCIK